MTKDEIKKRITIIEKEIIIKLEKMGHNSSIIELPSGKTIKNNQLFNTIISYFYKGFYDNFSKELREEFKINDSYSIEDYMTKELLEYKAKGVARIYEIICECGLLETKDELGIKERIKWLGNDLKLQYKKQYNITPHKELKLFNDKDYLEKLLIEKIKYFQKFDEDLLRIKAKEKTQKLQSFLPSYYQEKTAYGTAIGVLNASFYGYESKAIFENLRILKIRNSKTNLIDMMDKNQLAYRIAALYYVEAYKNKYLKEDLNLFTKKIATIGAIARKQFIKENEIEPYYDLIEYVKENNQTKSNKYKLKSQEQTIFANKDDKISDGEQLDLLNMLNNESTKNKPI